MVDREDHVAGVAVVPPHAVDVQVQGEAWGAPISSAVTSQGPSGLKVSQGLPRGHWDEYSNWNSRSETS